MRREIALSVALLGFAGSAQAAGFDCTQAHTPAEHYICTHPQISAYDTELNRRYRRLMRALTHNPRLRPAARTRMQHVYRRRMQAWIEDRDTYCAPFDAWFTDKCMQGYYARQNRLLWDILAHDHPDKASERMLRYRLYRRENTPYIDEEALRQVAAPAQMRRWLKARDDWADPLTRPVCRDVPAPKLEACMHQAAHQAQAAWERLIAHCGAHRRIEESGRVIRISRALVRSGDEEYCQECRIFRRAQLRKLFDPGALQAWPLIDCERNATGRSSCTSETSRHHTTETERIAYITPHYVVLEDYLHTYTGGMHGDFQTEYALYDRHTGAHLVWSDLFVDAAPLREKIIALTRRTIETDPSDDNRSLFAQAVSNFELTPEGATFHFGLYTAGYADGEPHFALSRTFLRPYMRPRIYRCAFAPDEPIRDTCDPHGLPKIP